jgi:hypothetical protein
MYSIRRVHLQHALTTTTCKSPLLPLDVLTRCRVPDAIQAILPKRNWLATMIREGTAGVSTSPSQRNEAAFADGAMLEDRFDAEIWLVLACCSRNGVDVQMERNALSMTTS